MNKDFLLFLSRLTKPLYGGIGHILMFHRVTPQLPRRVPGQSTLEVTSEHFEEIISYFRKKGYNFVSLDQISEILDKRKSPGKFLSITFDDGYLDNFLYAYPILKKYQIPFTIYVATSFPDHKAVLWWYMLDDLILNNKTLEFDFLTNKLDFDCSSMEGKKNTSLHLRRLIKFADQQSYHYILKNVFEPYGINLYEKSRQLALSWDQIRELSQDPLVTIGSHSVHHYILKNLSEEAARNEILESTREIEAVIQKPVKHFAYPYGDKNEAGWREFEIVKELGFTTAVTTRFANIFYAHARHKECLPRFDMPSFRDFDQFTLAANGLTPCRKNRFKRVITY